MYTLKIPEATPSLNRYSFAHWRKQHGDKKRWLKHIIEASLWRVPIAMQKRRVTIERVSHRELDVDNLYGGLKPVIDGLKKAKLIIDDNSRSIELIAKQSKLPSGGTPHTIITLEDLI